MKKALFRVSAILLPMNEFYDYLKELGIVSPSDVPKIILKMSTENLINVAIHCYVLTERKPPSPEENSFSFTVNSSISGGIHPCSDIACRLKQANEFASLTAMYVDAVYMPNFFEYMYMVSAEGHSFRNAQQFANFRNRFIIDLILMLRLKPLFLANILRINPQLGSYCSRHLAEKKTYEENLITRFKKIEGDVISQLVTKVKFSISAQNTLIPDDPGNFLGGGVNRFINLPEQLLKYRKLAPYTFTDAEVINLGIWEPFVVPIFEDLISQKYSMNTSDLAYLTNRKIESEIINLLDTEHSGTATEMLIGGLVHDLPFIRNAPLDALLILRAQQPESFKCYRDAVRLAVSQAQDVDDPKTIQLIKNDVILPALNQINKIVTNNRDEFVTKGFRDAAISSAALTAFLFSSGHGLPGAGNITLGTTVVKKAISTCENFCRAFDVPATAKNNDYYFLWEISQMHAE